MLFHYFTTQKMNYQTDQLETAILMEEVTTDRHDNIEREHSFLLPHSMGYLENPLMLTPSDYKELTALLDGSSPYSTFRGNVKATWEKLLENCEHKTISL